MVSQHLARIESLKHLPHTELSSLARHVKVLCIPAERWLVTERRVLDQYLYLLRGKLLLDIHPRMIRARSIGRLEHFYPGVTKAKTASACQVLILPARHRAFALERGGSDAQIATEGEQWLSAFLTTELMQHLDTAIVAQVLRQLSRKHVAAGQAVIHEGQSADRCFVVEQGNAVVCLQGRELKNLQPGDFFGEDSLIRGGKQSTTVIATAPLTLRVLHVHEFKSQLLGRLVVPIASTRLADRIDVNSWQRSGSYARARIRELNKGSEYLVSGADQDFVTLVVFLMLQAGIKANAA